MHINSNLLFYVTSVLLVIFALSTQHWKCGLGNSHGGHVLHTQPALCPQLPCIQVRANWSSVLSPLLGTHAVWRGCFRTDCEPVPKEARWGWSRQYPEAASIGHCRYTANDSNLRDTFFSSLRICQEYRTGEVGKSYLTYAAFIQLPV